MSQSALARFADAAVTDPELRARCQAAPGLDALVAVAAGAGFEVTEAEMRGFLESVRAGSRELADDELEAVAGGVNINNSHRVDQAAVNINNSHRVDQAAVNINNSHREVFGGFGWP